MGELQVSYRDEEICTARWGSVFVSVFREWATPESVAVMDREEGRVAAEHPRFTFFCVVPDVPMRRPPSGLGERANDMMRRYGPQLTGAAVVLGGRGFLVSMVRSLVSAAVLVSRAEAPTRIFDDTELASRWVAGLPRQPQPVDAAALSREVTRLMNELGVWL